jgi:hypothetical protein
MTSPTQPAKQILAGLACVALITCVAFSRPGTRGATGGSVTPGGSPVPGMALWLKADNGPSCGGACSSGNRVASWADQSGNENNATTVTGAPAYIPNEVNGLPAISNAGEMTLASKIAWTGQITAFVEFAESTAAADEIFSGTGPAPFAFRTNSRHQEAEVPRVADILTGSAALNAGQFYQGNVAYNNSTGAVSLRIGEAPDGSGTIIQKVASGDNVIFQFHDAGNTLDLAELIVYTSVLSNANIIANENYLRGKYGN